MSRDMTSRHQSPKYHDVARNLQRDEGTICEVVTLQGMTS